MVGCSLMIVVCDMFHFGFQSYLTIRLVWCADASRQSPDMGDVLLHETAVALFRKRMRYEQAMVAPWKETPDQWTARAKAAASAATKEYDLHGLCREFPGRLRALADNDGRRLKK